jgi:8-oxo-dGTP pyrophosphatase MutT (NUDIX family)
VRILHKAVALVVRDGARGPELLVFRDARGVVQVPKGTLESGETPESAVRRELTEESGVSDAVVTHALGTIVRDGTTPRDRPADGLSGIWTGTRHVWHLFALCPTAALPDHWEHEVTGGEEETGLRFAYRWVPLDEVAAVLHPAFGDALEALRAELER